MKRRNFFKTAALSTTAAIVLLVAQSVPTPKTINILIFLFLLSLVFFPVEAANDSGKDNVWKAGVARVVITPEEPMWLAGFAARTHPSEGKLHDLWAKALAIEDAKGERAVLVTIDLSGIPKNLSDKICDRLKIEYKLSRSQVILNTSHTHSGPVLSDWLVDIYPMDSIEWEKVEQYTGKLTGKIVKMVGKALKSMEPAKLYAGNGVTRFQVNRRNNNERTLLEQTELKGPNDYAVPVLKVANLKGKLLAVAFGYACHATVLNGYEWSGDYPGFAQIELEKSFRGATAMFFQGAGADQNPLPRNSKTLAQQYGCELACAVERILREDMKPLLPTLSTAYSTVDLQLNDLPDEEELLRIANNSSNYEQYWANRFLNKTKRGEPIINSYPYPLQVWNLGGQLMVAMGGEPVIEYAIKLKQLFGQDIFVLGYSNDVMAYIPSVKVLKEGGYEGETSQKAFQMPGKWKPSIEKVILEGIVKLAGQAGVLNTEYVNHLKNKP